MNNHWLQDTEEEPVTPETIAAATATHTRYLSSPAAATLHGKTPGFVLRLSPQHRPHATVMPPLQCVLQHHVSNPHVSAHVATKRDNNHAAITLRAATRDSPSAEVCTHEQPPAAEDRGGTDYARNHRSRNRRTHKVPFTAGCNHFTRRKHQVLCSGFLPNTNPMQQSCGHYNAFCSITWQTCMSRHMATKRDNYHAAITLRSATRDSTSA